MLKIFVPQSQLITSDRYMHDDQLSGENCMLDSFNKLHANDAWLEPLDSHFKLWHRTSVCLREPQVYHQSETEGLTMMDLDPFKSC